MSTDLASTARALKALGDEGRLRLVALLSRRELCVCHLVAALKAPQPTVSRQLGILRAAGLVDARRDGSWIHYRLARPADAGVRATLASVAKGFDARALDRQVDALVRKLGPGACK